MSRTATLRRGTRAFAASAALFAILVAAVLLPDAVRADEGMWTFDHLPLQRLQERYDFTPTPEWVEHVQRASINFGGGSGAFVSPDGLALTNHHVALGQMAKMSSPGHDYVRDGFFARTRAEELPCPDLELKVLMTSQDVTARVLGAVDSAAVDQRAERPAQGGHGPHRAGGEPRRAQGRGGRAVPRWRVLALPLQDLQGRAPGVRARGAGRLLRRRPRQLLLSRATTWTSPSSASTRTAGRSARSTGSAGARRARARATSSSWRAIRARPSDSTPWRNSTTSGTCDLPLRIRLNEQRLAAYRAYGARGPEQERQARDRVRGLENNLKRQHGFLEVLSDSGGDEGAPRPPRRPCASASPRTRRSRGWRASPGSASPAP